MDHGAGDRDALSAVTGPNRRATGRAVGIAVAVVVVAAVVGWIVLPEGWQGPVTVLAVIAALTLTAAIALPRWAERVWPIAVLALVAIGTVLVGLSSTARPYGIVAFLLAVAVFPAFPVAALPHLKAWASDQPTPPPPRPRTVATALVSGAMIAATVLGFLGMAASTDGQYVVRHGQPVTVTLGERCTVFRDTSDVITSTCPDSQWTIDGQTYRGTAHLGGYPPFLNAGPGGTRTVEAYALPGDDDAYTERYAAGGIEGLHVFAGVPWWLSLATPLLIVALVVRAVVRRIRRPSPSGGAPSPGEG